MSAYSDGYKLIQWSPPKPSAPKPDEPNGPSGPFLMPDITPFVSPLSGKVISSRTQLRHEERGYGVRQCGELKSVTDFDNFKNKPQATNEKALESAYRAALEKTGLL